MRGLVGSLVRGAQNITRGVPGDTESFWNGDFWSSPSATGIQVNQQTALQATAVMACVRILAEDVSKMTPRLYQRHDLLGHKNGARVHIDAAEHPVAALLRRPNDWQTWPEFCRMMVVAYALRGNAYAVILRNRRGEPTALVPINPDRVALWQARDGGLFWWITRSGLHELWVLRNMPWIIPHEDVFHLKDLSADGLVGTSPIALAREAIALSLAQEQQYARLMGRGARPSGVLTTEQRLSKESSEKLRDDWNKLNAGLVNAGGTAVLEQGLKWQPISINSVDLQFLQMREFQLHEICRIFRIPPHMVGEAPKNNKADLVEVAQEYRNHTLTSHTDVWEARFDFTFDLYKDNYEVDFDESVLTKADVTTRYNAYRIAVLSGWQTRNEVRILEKMPPLDGLDEPIVPANEVAGSDLGGDNPGAGKPSESLDPDNQPMPDGTEA